MKPKHRGQMSESFLTAVFLSLSGGLQDAYTYLFRGKVFANAQTGNIVLLSSNLMDGNWERVLHYLVPLCVWSRTRDPKAKDRMLRYFGIILLFALGSGIGSKSCVWLGGRTIWISCGLLLVSFALMFIREDLEANPVIEKDLAEIRQETREIDHALRQELQEQQQELKESAAPRHR